MICQSCAVGVIGPNATQELLGVIVGITLAHDASVVRIGISAITSIRRLLFRILSRLKVFRLLFNFAGMLGPEPQCKPANQLPQKPPKNAAEESGHYSLSMSAGTP